MDIIKDTENIVIYNGNAYPNQIVDILHNRDGYQIGIWEVGVNRTRVITPLPLGGATRIVWHEVGKYKKYGNEE